MATTESSASTAHPSTHYVPASEAPGDLEHVGSVIARALNPRLKRGLSLAQERFEEIERLAPWAWSVPSCSGSGAYTINLKQGTCDCPDRVPKGERCKHEHAARYVKAKTGPCAGCGRRFRFRDLFPVPDDHLTFFGEDELCRECAGAHGVL